MREGEHSIPMQETRTILDDVQVRTYPDGMGPVEPTGEASDAEMVLAVKEAQRPIEDPHVVCMDERGALEKQPVRAKMAGGNVTTCFAGAELADWSGYTNAEREAEPEARVDSVADYLVKANKKLGAHIDNHATEEASNCGAADGYPVIIGLLGEHGNDDEFVAQMKDALGGNFSQEVWSAIVERAKAKAVKPELRKWNGNIIIGAVKKRDGVVEVLNGDNKHPDKDPENKRHNHWGEAVGINTKPGMSNDRDNAGKPFFQVDAPAIVEHAQAMAKDESECIRLVHAMVGYQFATRFKLTRGQRNITV